MDRFVTLLVINNSQAIIHQRWSLSLRYHIFGDFLEIFFCQCVSVKLVRIFHAKIWMWYYKAYETSCPIIDPKLVHFSNFFTSQSLKLYPLHTISHIILQTLLCGLYQWMCIKWFAHSLVILSNGTDPFQIVRQKRRYWLDFNKTCGSSYRNLWQLRHIPSLMMTSWNGNIFRFTVPLCGEFTGYRWSPLTKASDAEFWCFLWSAPEQTVE